MKIWQREISLAVITARNHNTMSAYLGITFIELGDDYLVARMPIDHRLLQPMGIMHGGASCVLAETVGSVAANFCVPEGLYCVGLDINTNHLRPVKSGHVLATARPFHLGQRTQVWGIEATNEAGKRVAINRLTMAVLAEGP